MSHSAFIMQKEMSRKHLLDIESQVLLQNIPSGSEEDFSMKHFLFLIKI